MANQKYFLKPNFFLLHPMMLNISIPQMFRQQSKLVLRSYNICSGRLELESRFPVDVAAFLGLGQHNVAFRSTGESEFVSLLLDGNRTVYPIVKDSTASADSIRWRKLT
jgi:hypothetical protein